MRGPERASGLPGPSPDFVAKLLATSRPLSPAARAQPAELGRRRDGTHVSDQGVYRATVAPDGTVALKDARNLQIDAFLIIAIAGHFDVTDWLMRERGADPYASAKLAFLDRTRDERVAIGTRGRSAQLRQVPVLVRQQLDQVWATTPDPAQRKHAAFELWDDCAETGDAELVSAAAGARQVVIDFLRAHDVGFTAAELGALNASRRSQAMFVP